MKLEEKPVLLRKEKGITQLELAEAVKVSRQAVSKWESGGSLPSTESLRGLSELYGVSVDYLLNEDDRGPEDDRALREEREQSPEPVGDRKRKPLIKWAAVVLVVFVLVVLIGVFFAAKREEETIWIDEMRGEEVEPSRNFNVGW